MPFPDPNPAPTRCELCGAEKHGHEYDAPNRSDHLIVVAIVQAYQAQPKMMQAMLMYAAGTKCEVIAAEMGVSRARVSRLLAKADEKFCGWRAAWRTTKTKNQRNFLCLP